MQKQIIKIEVLIDILRKLKKSDPLFKLLKKLKISIELLGQQKILSIPSKFVAIFHFGLGSEIDLLMLQQKTNLKKALNKNNFILPGKPFGVLQFANITNAQQYMNDQNALYSSSRYLQIEYESLNRLVVFIYCGSEAMFQEQINVMNCARQYKMQNISGLHMIPKFINNEEQLQLLHWIDLNKWQKLNNRRVQHYGYQFQYGENNINQKQQFKQIPINFNSVLKKLQQIQLLKKMQFDQLTINDYFAGDGIPSHFDTHSPFQEYFVTISLLSGIVMQFIKFNGREQNIYIERGSLMIFSGEARYAWKHGISCRKIDKIDRKLQHRSRRLSLTFRKLRQDPCQCNYYFYCDSQGYDQSVMKKKNPLLKKYLAQSQKHGEILEGMAPFEIEQQYVSNAYNGFGIHFHNQPIEGIINYLKECKQGEVVVDLGCGNGDYSKFISINCYYLGIQKCTTMLPVPNQLYMNALKLTIRSSTIDRILLVAVLHHLSSFERRLQCLKEIKRIMQQNATVYISVFNYQPKKNIYKCQDIFLQYCVPFNQLHLETIKQLQSQDNNFNLNQSQFITSKGRFYKRYYHLFTEQQIRSLFQLSGLAIEQLYFDDENIIIKAKSSIKNQK